jgi:hypothetical protein
MTEREAVAQLLRLNTSQDLWEHVEFIVRFRRSRALRRHWRYMLRQHMKALALVGGDKP